MFERMVFEDHDEIEEETHGAVVTKNVCTSCGGSFCSDMDGKIDTCIFCGSKNLSSEDFVEAKQYFMIPFVIDMNEANALFHKKTFWNPLVPFSFKFRKNKPKISKVFIPTVLVNVNQNGKILFLGGEKQKTKRNGKRCTELKKYEVVQDVNVDYRNVLLNSTSKVEDKVFVNICHYDYDHLKPLEIPDLKDSVYISSDIPVGEVGERGKEKIIKHTLSMARENVGHPLRKLQEDQSSVSFYDAKEVLVPSYMLNINYQGKRYQFFMNGEDGKCYFKLPVSILSTILFALFVFGIVFLIGYLVALYL